MEACFKRKDFSIDLDLLSKDRIKAELNEDKYIVRYKTRIFHFK